MPGRDFLRLAPRANSPRHHFLLAWTSALANYCLAISTIFDKMISHVFSFPNVKARSGFPTPEPAIDAMRSLCHPATQHIPLCCPCLSNIYRCCPTPAPASADILQIQSVANNKGTAFLFCRNHRMSDF